MSCVLPRRDGAELRNCGGSADAGIVGCTTRVRWLSSALIAAVELVVSGYT